MGLLNAMTRLISVLLPDPLDPTRAVVVPGGAVSDTSRSTGTPASYSNPTCSSRTSPPTVPTAARARSSSSSVAMLRISRIRSRPANASVICVPIDEIWMTGAISNPVNSRYCTSAPVVHVPAMRACPPSTIISAPIAPIMSVATDETADTPVTVFATLRNSRCAPRANTICSRFSTVYALTTRMPPSVSPSRPVTSAFSLPRARNIGRSQENVSDMQAPKMISTTRVRLVSCQLR